MKLTEIRPIAEELVELLRPACERIEIAGSIRREKAECNDIEVVCIPRYREGFMLSIDSAVDDCIGELCGVITDPSFYFGAPVLEFQHNAKGKPRANGPKYKALRYLQTGLNIDLFICQADNWGNIMVIRTGPAAFSSWLVSPRSKGGCMPEGMRQQDGLLVRYSPFATDLHPDSEVERAIPCPDEETYFGHLGLEYIEPRERRAPEGWV